MSVNNCNDIAPLDDLEDIPDLESDISEHVHEFTQQLEQLTSSLNSPEPETPLSIPSIPEDLTPVVEPSYLVASTEPSNIISTIKDDFIIIEKSKIEKHVDKYDKPDSAVVTNNHVISSHSGMKFPEEREATKVEKKENEATAKKETAVPPKTSSLFHSFSFKEEKPAPLASPEQDKLPEPHPEPPKIVHKAPEIKKRIDLQPLNLKKNYEFDHEKEPKRTISEIKTNTIGRDKTPGQDLLEWCKEVTRNYDTIKVSNLSTSFKNGMAFCCIIAHYRPELIDMDSLVPSDIVGNCKKAFEAGEKLGIPRVIEPSDMSLLAVPDKLAVMTYLYQLHAHFTGRQLEVDRIGKLFFCVNIWLLNALTKHGFKCVLIVNKILIFRSNDR